MSKTAIATNLAPAAIGPYSQGVRVGSLVFTAGQIALDPSTQQVVVTQQVVTLGEGQTWVHKLTRKPGQTVRVTVALSTHPDEVLVSVNLARPVS